MQLKYRGISYQISDVSVNVEPTLQPETYRGVRF
ncbi:MAG: DUF4278 domain-containing protein [Cyanobacteria bacterium P01_F01_bin.13]